MSYIRNLLVAGSGIGFGSYAYMSYYISNEAEKISLKFEEEAKALEKINFIFDTANSIPHKHTSENHYFTVGSLSLKDDLIAKEFKNELEKVKTSYYAGYLQQTLQENRLEKLVFEYQDNLQVALPTFEGQSHKGFVFSGTVEKMINLKAHEDILKGNYVRCEMSCEVRLRDSSDDILITGTTDCKKCYEFVNIVIADAAVAASLMCTKNKIDSLNVLSDTPVFELTKDGFTEVGDLMSIPESTRKEIVFGEFTACNYYTMRKTRMSHGMYKKLPSVITGITNPDACLALSMNTMKNQINSLKNQNNQ